MKKLALLVGVLGLTTTTFAQKPAAADAPMSLEGVINFSGSSLQWQAPTVRYRYFVNDNIAARIQIGLGDGMGTPMSESYLHREYTNVDSTLVQGSTDIKRMAWNAQIGGEYHLSGTDRISPYFMLGINFGGGSESASSVDSDGTDQYVLGGSPGMGSYVDGYSSNFSQKMSMFGIGIGAGLDIYIIENVYMGFELGFNFASYNYKDATYDWSFTSGSTTTSEAYAYDGMKESNMSTGAGSAAIRLGWRF